MAWQQTLLVRWNVLGVREKRALQLAAAVVAAALVWSVGLAPALRTLKAADTQNAQLAAAAERMQALQARAKELQAKPVVTPQESMMALRTAMAPLGKSATLQVLGEQASVAIRQAKAQDLAALLAPTSSLPGPAEVHLLRDTNTAEPRWSGTLVFHLPAQKTGAP